jgi:hypothetical protein
MGARILRRKLEEIADRFHRPLLLASSGSHSTHRNQCKDSSSEAPKLIARKQLEVLGFGSSRFCLFVLLYSLLFSSIFVMWVRWKKRRSGVSALGRRDDHG